MCPAVELELDVDYSFYGKLTYLLPSYGSGDTGYAVWRRGTDEAAPASGEAGAGWKRNCGNFPPEQWLLW